MVPLPLFYSTMRKENDREYEYLMKNGFKEPFKIP